MRIPSDEHVIVVSSEVQRQVTQLPAGWLTEEEANELRRLARGETVLELGAWKGRSTVVMAEVAEHVVSVDIHKGIAEVGGEDSLPDYLSVVRQLDNVSIVIADFERIVGLLANFDMVYVDGNHDAESAERDARMALAHIVEGGTVAFHDWDFQSVRDGVGKVLPRSPDRVEGSVASFIPR